MLSTPMVVQRFIVLGNTLLNLEVPHPPWPNVR